MPKSRSLLRRWPLIGLLLLIPAAAAAAYYFGRTPPQPPPSVPVRLGDIEQTVLATGTLEAKEMVSVGAQVSGQVIRLAVELGQTVTQGDLIAEIDSVTQRNALRTAEASLKAFQAQKRQQQANLVRDRAAFARQRQMLSADATSRAEFEVAQASLAATEAQIEALEAQIVQAQISVETARANLGYTRITSPIDGTVVAIVTKQGQTVNANQTAPTIVKIANLNEMTVKAEISEADVTRVRPGQEAYFTILGEPDRRYTTTLRSVEPAPESLQSESSSASNAASSSTSTAIYYNGLLDVPNPEGRLRISMTAQVSIVLDRAQNVPLIPSAALGNRRRDGSYTVLVADPDGGPAQPRQIRVGLNNNAVAEVREGLAEGERVVIGQGSAGGASAAITPRRMGPSPMGL
ncbi:efflux RND transporter periplasmic adaptor subunit [Rhodocista pekingensis]|uniref:Efflux RND transporter periplasmic adaptor subunit n=1 Tax=Rhodocista pekingensis TaxID=201185 RepID=A0ABW2KY10_9PROT